MPGQLNWVDDSHDVDAAFGSVSSIAYVIDCQTEYFTSLRRLKETIEKVVKVNPNLHIEVLIHKIDGLSDDFRLDIQREIIQRVTDDLADSNLDHLQVSFYLTSIYDRSIHEAFSRIVQRLIPEIPTLENMLNSLCVRSGIEKTFLVDTTSKLYVATDKSPVDPLIYEICSDFIDTAVDIDNLYGPSDANSKGETSDPSPQINAVGGSEDQASANIDNSIHSIHSNDQLQNGDAQSAPSVRRRHCVSKMNNGIVLYMSEMIRGLALVGFIREESIQKMSLIDYNVEIFAQSLEKIWPQYSQC